MLAVSPDLRLFVSKSTDGSRPVTIRELVDRARRHHARRDERGRVQREVQCEWQRSVVTVPVAADVWATSPGKRLSHDRRGRPSPSFSFDGNRIVIGARARAVYTTDGTLVRRSRPAASDAALNRDGTLAVTWEVVHRLWRPAVVWDVASGTPKFPARSAGANVGAFSPMRDEVVTGDKQGVVRVFDLSQIRPPRRRAAPAHGEISSVAFSRDGERVVSGLVRQHRPACGSHGPVPRSHSAATPRPSNRRCSTTAAPGSVTIHDDDTVKIWDTAPFHATGGAAHQRCLAIRSSRFPRRSVLTGIAGTKNATIVVRSTRTGRRMLSVSSRDGRDGRFDAAISGDGRVGRGRDP